MEYWKPSVTVDIVTVDNHFAKWRDDGTFINLILVKRKDDAEAFPSCWALPGGFLEKGETIEQCAVRELKEETGLEAKMLAPMVVFSDPGRDPRGQVISHSFFTQFISTDEQPLHLKAGDDASSVALFNLKGDFNRENGSLSVSLRCVENGERIVFYAEFDRAELGLIKTRIYYNDEKTTTRLAFDHAEIIARTILRVPDLVLPTSDKTLKSRVEHVAPDPNSEAEMKKQLARHMAE